MGSSGIKRRAARVGDELAPVVATAGYDLEDVSVRPAGRRWQVIVTVDADVVDSDGLAELSRQISEVLDAGEAMGDDSYTLEVSSRGVGAPLVRKRHWRRNIGRLVAVHLHDGTGFTGRITDVNSDGAVVDGRQVPFDEVARAVVQVEFGEGSDGH